MNRVVLSALGLSLVLAACSDDGTVTGSASDGGSTSAATVTDGGSNSDTTPSTSNSSNSSTPTTTDGSGSATDGMTGPDTATTDPSGTTAGTDPSGTTASTDPSGTTGNVMTTGNPETCGDGVVDPGEECDDGNNADGDGCSANCTAEAPVCGNGKVEGNEACDDGNQVGGDGCENDCTVTPNPCGNGVIDPGEQCDGAMLPETSCMALDMQYSGGTVTCAMNCTYDFSACEKCEAPGMVAACDADAYIKGTNDDILHAMELACNTADPMFADSNKHVPVSNYMATNVAAGSWRVAKQFGTYLDPMDMNKPLWRPRKGDRMLIISSGNLPAPNGQGVVTQAGGTVSGTNGNPDNLGDTPGIMNWQKGSANGNGGTPFMNCDKVNDCSDTIDAQWNLGTKSANDVFYIQFNVAVPKGTHGYVVDFAYFSSEYPTWVNTSFNDMAILWQVSETYTGNVTFITDNNNNPRPLTVTALAQNGLMKFTGNAAQLTNTGFVGNGGTGWATVKGPAKPQETVTLAWSVFDKGDTILDTVLLIDNWKWDCEGCVPSEIDSCGVQPQ